MDSSSVRAPPSSSSTMVSSLARASSKLGPRSPSAWGGVSRFLSAIISSWTHRLDPGVGVAASELERDSLTHVEHRGGAHEPTVRAAGDAKAALQDQPRREGAQAVRAGGEARAALLDAAH